MEQVRNEQTIYSAAVYCRLSKDDEQAGESVSIETQKMMLTDFCHERGFSIYEIYADDGFSGLNFNRPAFTRLLEDIDSGKVNLVITKDLSRLGRDYIQTGYYTDVYFSRKRVRYIAVNDGIDTNRDDNDIAPFKNILNDMYAKDLSRKVKSAKRQRAYKGYYISAQAPYGYKVDHANRNRLIVDEEAAEVVKEIFRLALAGHSLSQISRILSQRKIITPGVYKAQSGLYSLAFTYNDEGIRTSKYVYNNKSDDETTHKYTLDGSRIISEQWGNHFIAYLYDESGAPIGMQYRTSSYAEDVFDTYYFEKNLQGDIVAVYNASGVKLISYSYDAWGHHTTTYSNGGGSTGAQYNPFRYRGYYYDTDLGL